ncbi:phasin [Rhizobium binae]|uniref:Phasin n=1 Tax=Rhizobium binae TaxID=1138190 RepID=A0ABV2ME28_9HYPH|nr:phasin [Rhizobium binae]NKL48398.1 phasin [Rhizobium leguminosarum bv. viciae]MBX4952493.1 phasin [Rhizobium binae]MBX4961133.1 phasin [Rhizobium binae]MBX4989937.1 phasin [Rhizobium binae]QSY82968.1 phasin [Rhizobium binae]
MATIKTDDVFSIASFDPSKLAESFREFAEKGAQQSKDAYAKLKTAGEEAGKTLEATVQTAQAGTVEIGLKAIDVLRVNAESSLSHMEALLGVKSIAEFVELQTSFLRKQAEIAVDQAKSMQETTKQVAEKLAKPSKEAAEKAMASFKVA